MDLQMIEAANLVLQLQVQALTNIAAIIQQQYDMQTQDRRLKGQPRKAKKTWTKSWLRRREKLGWHNQLIKELAVEEPQDYYNFMRMDEAFFNEILARITPKVERIPNNYRPSMPPGLMLSIALR